MSTNTKTLGTAALALASFVAQPQSFAADPIVISTGATVLHPLTADRRIAAYNAAFVACLPIMAEINEDELPLTREAADRLRLDCFHEAFATFPATALELVKQIESDYLEQFREQLTNIVESWVNFLSRLNADRIERLSKLSMADRDFVADVLMSLGVKAWSGPGKAGGKIVRAIQQDSSRRTAQRRLEKLWKALALSEKQDID